MSRVIAGALALLMTGCGQQPAPLPVLQLDPQRVAVAGISSGAIMAQQLHLAYSDHLLGAALLAGPPYQCAQGSIERALGYCLAAAGAEPDMSGLVAEVATRAQRGDLAPLAGLEGDRVLVAHGRRDVLVAESMARSALGLYEAMPAAASMQLRWDGAGDFAHVWPTLDKGGDCQTTAPPYVGNCNVDFAAEIMRSLFAAPARGAPAEAGGALLSFDQDPYVPNDEDAYLSASGRLYQPPQCGQDKSCGLLIVLHGCEQNVDTLGESFVRDNGLNRWADAYDVVVLYPQARASYVPLNPKGCWDWWGYSGADYDTRKGVQLRAIANMSAALGAKLQ